MTIAEMIDVLQAAERGEEIEVRTRNMTSQWQLISSPCWDFNHHDYRVKPKPRMVPLEPSDVPPGSVLKENSSTTRWLVLSVFKLGIKTIESTYGWEYLFKDECYEISRDGGRTWSRCEKPESV